MRITGVIRAKNAAKWIAVSIRSMLVICESVHILDDHSTDNTVMVARVTDPDIWLPRVHVYPSLESTLNEARDKTFITDIVSRNSDWILMLDADEVLLDPFHLQANLLSVRAPAYAVQILTLWDRPDQIRVDGIYADLWRPSVFRVDATNGIWTEQIPGGSNLHCGSVPTDLASKAVRCDPLVRVKHYGSMDREERIRKYHWYLTNDNSNLENEDHYHHSVQGDLPEFPADAVYRHGGPLKLQDWRP